MIKDNKTKKTRFGIVDLIIILFVILAAAGILMRLNLAEEITLGANMETYEIEFIIGDIQEASQDFLTVGEKFHVDSASIEIGVITEILDIRNPAPIYVTDRNGNIIKSESPGRIEIIGVMESSGRTTKDGSHMINGNIFVAANKEFFVHTGKIEGMIRVLKVTKTG
ncbi:MAG: DUF4330 domain-containing protein [Oscillospiraceae bacterium]|nr:DUF4330 domain-containing protein [Oscillospiraceae bacterium]